MPPRYLANKIRTAINGLALAQNQALNLPSIVIAYLVSLPIPTMPIPSAATARIFHHHRKNVLGTTCNLISALCVESALTCLVYPTIAPGTGTRAMDLNVDGSLDICMQ